MPNVDPQIAPTLDSLAQRVQSLEDGLRMHRHTGWDLTQPLINTNISGAALVNDSTLGDGNSTSGTLTLLRASGRGSVYIRGGSIAAGDFANAGAKTGFIMGEDDTDGKDKFYFGSSTSYIKYDGTTLTVVGSVSVSKLDIPDTTTANSFHVDTSGNAWWGANVATGLSGANAYIDNTGHAVFKSVAIGGQAIQYIITNSGIFSYGDGSDGAATLNGSNTYSWAYAAVTVQLAFSGVAWSSGNTIDFTINGKSFSIHWNSSLNTQYGQIKTSGTLSTDVTNLLAFLQAPSSSNSQQTGFDSGSGMADLLSSFTWTKSGNTITGVSNNTKPQQISVADTGGATLATTVTFGGTQGNDYWLNRDIYLTDLTIATGVTLHPNGYRIFGTGTLTMNGTGKIDRSGLQGYAQQSFGGNSTLGGMGGGSLADGYLKGVPAGGDGQAGASGAPAIASLAALTNSIGVAGIGSNGGTDAAVTASNVKLIANWHLATLLDVSSTGATVKFNGSNSSNGGGGSGVGVNGCGGGGGASAGGLIAIYFRSIVIGASASISVNGGTGGNGTNQSGLGSGVSGNGNGGSGGVIVLVYNQISNAGSITATAGLAGSGGTGGSAGNAGIVYTFQLSL